MPPKGESRNRPSTSSSSSSSVEPLLNKILPASVQGLMSKFKCNNDSENKPALDSNPILQYFELGPEIASAGHTLVWTVHQGFRKSDRREVSIFIFDKRIADKLHKPKRKETILDSLRYSIQLLERWRHPKFLTIVHTLEESNSSLAFAAEPIIASLHNILTYKEYTPVLEADQQPIPPFPLSVTPGAPPPAPLTPSMRPKHANSYAFEAVEVAYGLIQVIDALHFMHYTAKQVHRNVCPQVILVTKRGTWKLFGLEFVEEVGRDPLDPISVPPWSLKVARIGQPHLDYMAPEMQTNAQCTILSDIYSFGLLACTLYNHGHSIIQANNNPILYIRQIENLDHHVKPLLRRMPVSLKEAVQRTLNREAHSRPTTQLLPLIQYFKDPSTFVKIDPDCPDKPDLVGALQHLDTIPYKDKDAKNFYFRETLTKALAYIPKRLRWMTVWPYLVGELKAQDVSPAAFLPLIWFINDTPREQFEVVILPVIRASFRSFVNDPRRLPNSYLVLENLQYVIQKCSDDEVNIDILPLLYKAMEDPSYQLQLSSLIALQTATNYMLERAITFRVIPKVKQMLESNPADVKIINLSLGVYENTTKKLDRNHVNDIVIPALLTIKLADPEIVFRTFKLLKDLVNEPRFAISTNTMATKLIPTLSPVSLNGALNLEQFSAVMELLYQMLDFIDQQQRIMITRPPPPSPLPERRRLRHQMSTDNVAPPFNIPNLRVEKRKTSSAEDMARKNSMCFAWIFGSNNPSESSDRNYLRVSNVFTNRRLSDNTLITPKIRVAPSCASSPGGTPGGSNSALPTRRHSSIGPQERRSSAVNLSPPTAAHHHRGRVGGSGSSLSVPSTSHLARSMIGGSMPNTSSSVPYLLTTSMQSIKSRRASAGVSGSQESQGILQQISSGVVRHLPTTPTRMSRSSNSQWSTIQGATAAGYNALRQTASTAVRKCPSLNISLAN
ncbi:SCY1-like protein 2 [Epargyreus clarus]|uniref:SCY1-like protein 2 n=1 Tax=Epargyreus clarus TaxID=520877 RepID=UPI003C2D74FA